MFTTDTTEALSRPKAEFQECECNRANDAQETLLAATISDSSEDTLVRFNYSHEDHQSVIGVGG